MKYVLNKPSEIANDLPIIVAISNSSKILFDMRFNLGLHLDKNVQVYKVV